ncbi:DUF6279 family lipoprotein [Bdellovibrio bacteriovorus]|uniref:DUF6279 family lipoprotein n=1 Tax=Bdellovibrio bacteriovorus TaxID=959 RepID=UPI0035A916F0
MQKILLLIAVSFTCLTACSRLDIAFNWADTFIASKVDDYFDISSKQSAALKKSLHHDFDKIKTAVLPDWIDNAKDLEQDISKGTLSEAKIRSVFSMVMKNVEQFTAHFADTAVGFIATADAKQLRYFSKAFHEKNKEDLEKFHNTKKYQNDYKEKYHKYFKMFLGSLTDSQKALIEKHISESPFPVELKVKNKETVFQKFLKESGSPESMKAFVRDFYAHPELYNDPQYQKAFSEYQRNLQRLVVDILLNMTAQQKKELLENLQEKVSQLERIRSRS